MENEMVGCAIDFCSFLFLFLLVEYSLMPGREGNDISALCFSVSVSISAFQKLLVWFIEPRKAALLLSPKTFYLCLRSTYCVVWAETFKNLKCFLLQCIILKDHYMIYSQEVTRILLFPDAIFFLINSSVD